MTNKEREDIENLINYAVKEGYVDVSAYEWTDEEKINYYNDCIAMEFIDL